MKRVLKYIGTCFLFLLIIVAYSYLLLFVWNRWLAHAMQWPHITFWDAFGIVSLVKLAGFCLRKKKCNCGTSSSPNSSDYKSSVKQYFISKYCSKESRNKL